jgi:hypothetical protein
LEKTAITTTSSTKGTKPSHKGENSHSKNTGEDDGLDIEHLKPDLNSKITAELEKSHREQLILLKDNKQNIIDFHHLQ